MPSNNPEVIPGSETVGKPKRKPVRRDPEKRRHQNVQAQKKYREKLRERLDKLEALAASAAKSAGAPTTSTGVPEVAATLGSCSSPTICVSNSSAATPAEYQLLTTPQSDVDPLALSIWDSTTHVDPSFLIPYQHNHNDSGGPYWTVTVGSCGCPIPHVQIRTQSPYPSNYGDVRILSFGPATPTISVPDPYSSTLRMDSVCTIAALYALGKHLGATEEMLCADESVSPFFRSGAAYSTDDTVRANTISTVQKLFKTLKPDLRPSKEQITVEHHLYIDMLPFPTLRNNIIAHQKEMDEDEFFMELVNGLVCWGGAGIGRRDRAEDDLGMASTGTPWDVRSWEAKDWFLKKYWTLLGGEHGELVRQTEWWRSIRGEEMVSVGCA